MNDDVHRRGWWKLPIINRRSWTWHDANHVVRAGEWYQNAVIYQIAPLIFQDSDGDGLGDLPGVIRRLDYIASLGVDAVWLTPFYPSPLADFGYDVVDHRGVGATFGSPRDFQRLLRLLHQRGLKLIVDMVWNHTSALHPWFVESRTSRDNPRADWYVWADPAPGGGPPNNWLSVLDGQPAWTLDETRGQYYFHNFFSSQPELNWGHPQVREAVLSLARHWLDQGVDGLRLDAVNFYCNDPALRDNPPRRPQDGMPDGIKPDNPATAQRFVNSFNRPDNVAVLRDLRRLVDAYPGVALLGETTLNEDSLAMAAEYTRGEHRLHLAYHSGLLFADDVTAGRLRGIIERANRLFEQGGTAWIMGNHDYGRMRSLWGGAAQADPDAFYAMMTALLLSLPGALCLWQGDELGLPEARIPQDIPPECLRDPIGIRRYPQLPGRDTSRTPMPWDGQLPMMGFTTGDAPYLPLPESHRRLAVAGQDADPESTLNVWRTLLHWRTRQPALKAGRLSLPPVPDPLLGLLREYHEQRLLCLFNISAAETRVRLDGFDQLVPAAGLGFAHGWDAAARVLTLPAWGVFFADLRSIHQMRAMQPDEP